MFDLVNAELAEISEAEREQRIQELYGDLKTLPQFNRERHGSLFDRGGADSYYHRERDPHWYPEGTYNGDRVTDLTGLEIAEYMAGYDYNEQYGNKKDWG